MSLFAPEDELLGALREEADRTGLPPTAISADAGRFLQVLLRSIGARRVLEVGTLGGYSAIWMARALPPAGVVVTLEREERHAEFARRYVARAGLAAVVDVRQGRALDILPSLDGEEFDLIYLDADRGPIATYFDWAMRLVRLGGLILAHNVLLGDPAAEQNIVRRDHSSEANEAHRPVEVRRDRSTVRVEIDQVELFPIERRQDVECATLSNVDR